MALVSHERFRLLDKIKLMHWELVLLITLLGGIGVALLYSAGGRNWSPWAFPQALRLMVGLGLMIGVALIHPRIWMANAYRLYGIVLFLLIVVAAMGHIGMGAQRWLNLGFFVLQPSELMKITLVLALARYFHSLDKADLGNPIKLIAPALMIAIPVVIVLDQPNLGTALLLILTGGAILFAAGVSWWVFILAALGAAIIAPIGWHHLHDYQRARLMTFLNPGSDPLGKGYNILQSKIALGSGGLWGRGFGEGTQSQLQFLPEKHTDFIFVVLAEEMGFVGAIAVLLLYVLVLAGSFQIALACRYRFGRLLGFGLTTTFFLYVFVNIAMVTGTIPVVGIPLPLISYGGTAMLTLLSGYGLILGVAAYRETRVGGEGTF